MPEAKKRLIDIRRSTTPRITSEQVARVANLLLCREFLIEIGGLVNREEAEQALSAFSKLTGKSYTFENVQVNVKLEPVGMGSKR